MISELDRQLIKYRAYIHYTKPELNPINNVPYSQVTTSAAVLYADKPSDTVRTMQSLLTKANRLLKALDPNGSIGKIINNNGHTLYNIRQVEDFVRSVRGIDGDVKAELAIELYDIAAYMSYLLNFALDAYASILKFERTGNIDADMRAYEAAEEEFINLLISYDKSIESKKIEVKGLLRSRIPANDPKVLSVQAEQITMEGRLDELRKHSSMLSELTTIANEQFLKADKIVDDIAWYVNQDQTDITESLISTLSEYPDNISAVIPTLKTNIYYSFATENHSINEETNKSLSSANKDSLKGVMDTIVIDSAAVSTHSYKSLVQLAKTANSGLVGKHILQGAVAANRLLESHALQLHTGGSEYIVMKRNIVKAIINKQEARHIYQTLSKIENLAQDNNLTLSQLAQSITNM